MGTGDGSEDKYGQLVNPCYSDISGRKSIGNIVSCDKCIISILVNSVYEVNDVLPTNSVCQVVNIFLVHFEHGSTKCVDGTVHGNWNTFG